MKLFHAVIRNAAAITAVLSISLGSNAALAQDSAFLACARHTDRGQRIACLEDALDAALSAQEENQSTTQAVSPPPVPVAPAVPSAAAQNPVASTPPVSTAPDAPAAAVAEPAERSSLLDRIRSFGRDEDASISTDESGNERLHDTIAALEKRGEMWIVTLASGQIWRQQYPRSLNLRVGDEISIYQEGIGNGYRLATPRLSGFIRVERTK